LNLDVLCHNAVVLCEPQEGVISFTHSTDGTTDGVSLELPIESACCPIHLSNVDLDGGMVLGTNDSVASRAFTGDVQVHEFTSVVLHLDFI
ncbi:hypothetical protein, partial [Enterobacter hormaechei]|uniref:hypothetical protein n=1 Tax=Enterobacter hormaechei TaxID=158836 RepID=UPI001C40769C